jgi:alkanesulfonate monooxygenase SsuD/methylene tetrahydromethanopterin reductase-like flavin-dependent oxidoreductase (luciferase family)
MPTGVVLQRSSVTNNAVDDIVAQARQAHAAGVQQIWLAQQFDHDAISLAVPVLVTDDAEAGREFAAGVLGFYATIPSYRRVLEREGVDSAVEVAAVGTADEVRAQLQRYLDAGATDLVLSPLRAAEDVDRERVWEVAAQL